MNYVYLVWDGYGKLRGVYRNKSEATIKVRTIAKEQFDVNPDTIPLDYSGSLFRYGWSDVAWWSKEMIY